MKQRYRTSALIIGIVAGLTGYLLLDKFMTANPARATQPSQKLEAQKWEYCAISDISYASGGNGVAPYYTVTIVYSSDPKNRVQTTILFPADPVLSSVSKLGADGWEMIGQGTQGFYGHTANYLYFKRPVK